MRAQKSPTREIPDIPMALRAQKSPPKVFGIAIDARDRTSGEGTSAVSRFRAARGNMPLRYARSERRPRTCPVYPS